MPLWTGDPGNTPPPPAGTSTGTLSQYANQYGVPLGGTGGTAPGAFPVSYIWMGAVKPTKVSGSEVKLWSGNETGMPGGDKLTTANDLLSEFEDMTKEEQRRLGLLLVLGGYNSGVTIDTKDVGKWVHDASLGDVLMAYSNLLKDAEAHFAIGQKVTPDQLLNKAINFRLPSWNGKRSSLDDLLGKLGIDISLDGDASQAGTFTSTSKTKTLDFMDPMDAKALARGVLQQELGRDPTQAEYEDFLAAIHAAEARNPDVTSTTQTYTTDAEGRMVDQNTSSVTHAGISGAGLAQMATEKAQANPNWAEWQAMGTYAPALFAALGSTVPGA